MASAEVYVVRLSEAERDALVVKLDAAAARLGAGKAPKMVFPNSDGTWDVGCTLEGDDTLVEEIRSHLYLYDDLP